MSLDDELEQLSTCQYIERQEAAFNRASLRMARDSAEAKLADRRKTLGGLPARSDLRSRVEADIVDLQNRISGYEAEMAAGTPDFSDKEIRENLIARAARHSGLKRKELAGEMWVAYSLLRLWARDRCEGRFKRHSSQVAQIEASLARFAKNMISSAPESPKTCPRGTENVPPKGGFGRKHDPKRRL